MIDFGAVKEAQLRVENFILQTQSDLRIIQNKLESQAYFIQKILEQLELQNDRDNDYTID